VNASPDIDFVRRERAIAPAGAVVLLIAVVSTAILGLHYRERLQQADALEARIAAQAGPARSERRAPVEVRAGEAEGARRVMGQLALPWSPLFAALEASLDERVALLGVVPDPRGGQLRINAEAKTLQDALAFVERIGRLDILRDAHLADHEIRTQDPQKPVRFTVSARWTTAMPRAGAGS